MIRSGEVAACSHVRDLLRTKLGSIRAKLAELRNLERQLAPDLKKCENTLRSARADSMIAARFWMRSLARIQFEQEGHDEG
jgi:hypothetical protein